MMNPYFDIKEESIKDYNPKTLAYESVQQIVIYLFDSFGEKLTYRFKKNDKNDVSNFKKTKEYFEKLIQNKEI